MKTLIDRTKHFSDLVYNKTKGEYTLKNISKSVNTNSVFIHNKCGKEINYTLNSFLSREDDFCRCESCKKEESTNLVNKRISEVENGSYTLKDTFINLHKDNILQHSCGHEYKVRLNNFLNQGGSRCPICTSVAPREHNVTEEEFTDYLLETDHLDRYEFNNSSYKGFDIPFEEITILKCGHTQKNSVTPRDFVSKRIVCSTCGFFHPKRLKTTKIFSTEVFLVERDYKVFGEYIGGKDKMKFSHSTNMGTHFFVMRPSDFLANGNRCPKCSAKMSQNSSGVRFIRDFLTENNIVFKENISLEGCIYKNKLRFDFLTYDSDNNLICAIEYDGKQHFTKHALASVKEYELQVKRDIAKNKFCLENNLPLFRIKYNLSNDEINKVMMNVQRLSKSD